MDLGPTTETQRHREDRAEKSPSGHPIGAAIGTVAALRVRTAVSWLKAVATLVLMAGLQFLALWISFQRGVSKDPW